MAERDDEFGFLTASVRRSVDLLRAHPQRGEIRHDERGSALVRHIDYTLDGIDAKLADAEANFSTAPQAEQLEYIKRARLLNLYARFMHRAVPWVAEAARPSLALGALYFIDELGESICGSRPDAVPNAQNDYSTEWWPFDQLTRNLGLPDQIEPIPVVINYPAREGASHLLLPLYAHELGHTAVFRADLDEVVLATKAGDATFDTEFRKAADQIAATTGQSPREARIALGWRTRWWATELLCDQLAIQALGPSYLFAFSAFVLSEAWDEPGDRHPPNCVRVAHLLAYSAASGWSPELTARVPNIVRWLTDDVAAATPKVVDESTRFVVYAMAELESAIREETAKHLGASVYAATQFQGDIGPITELTEYETLPVQLPSGDAMDRRSIMLAAWLSLLEPVDAPGTLAAAPGELRTQAFFAKAMEMSSLLSAWKTAP